MFAEIKSKKTINWLSNTITRGIPPFASAFEIAEFYRDNHPGKTTDEVVHNLIMSESSKNFATGFSTGIGGILTIPFSIPISLASSWAIQARMTGAIAHLYGHDLNDERIMTLVLLSLLGDSVKEVLKNSGVKIVEKLTASLLINLPASIFIKINQKLGFKLMEKAGKAGARGLVKIVPLAGGFFSGTIDAFATRKIGRTAQKMFS
ncbi:MAG: EcsC family protein [Deltaproteobacteria bacterium]|jgi:uncharacterized protein (DUF697 family)|nr:EcsC family protein [Deltaproteobacteria bacterium]